MLSAVKRYERHSRVFHSLTSPQVIESSGEEDKHGVEASEVDGIMPSPPVSFSPLCDSIT